MCNDKLATSIYVLLIVCMHFRSTTNFVVAHFESWTDKMLLLSNFARQQKHGWYKIRTCDPYLVEVML